MILIADSGSTKTDWRLLSGNTIDTYKSKGLNPYYLSSNDIQAELLQTLPSNVLSKVTHVFFYGAGCGSEAQQKSVSSTLGDILSKAHIVVKSDLLGAARAACGNTKGLVCILGTGSNSCLVDGGEIIEGSPSNGIWLGDEGSAGFMGKKLIQDYLNNELPNEIKEKFESRFQDRRSEILQHVYRMDRPNVYLASFSKFIYHNLNHTYFVHLVYQALDAFFQKTILKYTDYQTYPLYFVGSVAHYYKSILEQLATDYKLSITDILIAPIDRLSEYHQM